MKLATLAAAGSRSACEDLGALPRSLRRTRRRCASVLLVALACREPPGTNANRPAVPPMESSPPSTVQACDDSDRALPNFDCIADELCTAIDREDDSASLVEFLCVAKTASSRDGEQLQMGDILRELPGGFRRNFTMKHGLLETGRRGHVAEVIEEVVDPRLAANGQSADPDFPRLLMWDEATGFTISFNGGLVAEGANLRAQDGAGRLDLMRYDTNTHAFELLALDLPLTQRAPDGSWRIAPYAPAEEHDNCEGCHGPHGRPIWPMYPDWPGFYGSDNDELTHDSPHQRRELTWLGHFRRCVAIESGAPSQACVESRPRTVEQAGRLDYIDTRRRFDTLFADDLEQHAHSAFAAIDVPQLRSYLDALHSSLQGRSLARVLDPASGLPRDPDEDQLRAWLGLTLHPTFPYRPNHSEASAEPSRAFFHRPNLRLGVLYNRLLARHVFHRLQRHPVYRRFAGLVAFALMDCSWQADEATMRAALTSLQATAADRLEAYELELADARGRILYPGLLAALDLRVRDVDMRLSYPNPSFAPFDRGYDERALVENPMDLGYIAYASQDRHRIDDATSYFNSYFDGSATFDELLVALILDDLAQDSPQLRELYTPHSLHRKYVRATARTALDETFFQRMDALAPWLPLPYPARLKKLHDREPFDKRIDGRPVFIEQYRSVCTALLVDLRRDHTRVQ